jgi:hypothetical protein
MKKVMMVTALAALAAGAMAEDVVPSGNIVGYAKINLTQSRMMLGAMFQDIGIGHLQAISITTDASNSGSTKLSWWTGSGYETASWMDAWDVDDGVDIDLGI